LKIGFVLAGLAAAALFAAQPVMASETLSSDSLPAAPAKVKAEPRVTGTSRVAARKGSRMGDSEGALPAFIGSPFFIIGGIITSVFLADALEIIDFGIFHHVGPYGSVTA
jgi:hypothetical protein